MTQLCALETSEDRRRQERSSCLEWGRLGYTSYQLSLTFPVSKQSKCPWLVVANAHPFPSVNNEVIVEEQMRSILRGQPSLPGSHVVMQLSLG